MFTLDSRLAADSVYVTSLTLSQVRLMNDKRYPWLLLVPAVDNIKELIDLTHDQQLIVLDEINKLSHLVQSLWHPDKINIATLGNVVTQFHIHVIGRFKTDGVWPQPVWGQGTAEKYLASEMDTLIMRMQSYLKQSS